MFYRLCMNYLWPPEECAGLQQQVHSYRSCQTKCMRTIGKTAANTKSLSCKVPEIELGRNNIDRFQFQRVFNLLVRIQFQGLRHQSWKKKRKKTLTSAPPLFPDYFSSATVCGIALPGVDTTVTVHCLFSFGILQWNFFFPLEFQDGVFLSVTFSA